MLSLLLLLFCLSQVQQFLASNYNAVLERHKPDQVFAKTGELDPAAIEWAKRVAADASLDPVLTTFGPEHVGAVSERFEKELNEARIMHFH